MTQARAFSYWQMRFGLSVSERVEAGIHVLEHANEFSDYHGLYLLKSNDRLLVSAPKEELEQANGKLKHYAIEELWTTGILDGLFYDKFERIVGPAYQGYLEPRDFRPIETSAARALSIADKPTLLDFKSACDPLEWDHSSIELKDEDLSGYFFEGHLVSVAKLIYWADSVVNIGVITHPNYRAKGFAAATVSCAIQQALERDYLVMYQTLLSNKAAVLLAERLGFKAFGQSIAIRFLGD